MREAITFHVDGLREEGQAVHEPGSYSAYIELLAYKKAPLSISEALLFLVSC